ncbi:hypothetical protein LL037_12835 [Clostridium estertheticum]|uniref:hypothetical protein n=1 Tax=Clostridium estertheticum TaxID=238834 RepID=UPI001C0CBD10|nr:hypothetical protein [Clostridium estertheticum]MBU3200957.1 hypothetical protein [Clostridium estertheticum]WAG63380.1 hypothetical protein LL037_12835 [Clostridium estertheticum]
MLKKESFKLLVLMTASGLIMSIIEGLVIRTVTNVTFNILIIDTVLSLVAILLIGIFLLSGLRKQDIIVSVIIVIIYSLLALAIQQVMMKLEIYNAISYYWIYIPMRIFSFVTQWIMKLQGLSIYIGIFIADLAPLIFVAFGSKKQN